MASYSWAILVFLGAVVIRTTAQETISAAALISGPQGNLQRAVHALAVGAASVPINITSTNRFSGPAQDGWISGQSDFCLADIPLEADRLARAGREIVQFPVYAGAVQFHYNIPGFAELLRLDACTLAGIYSGTIRTWDAREIKARNPKLKVPAGQAITVIARNDNSNFTTLVTEYFAKGCPKGWALPVAQAITWPAGVTAVGGNALVPTFVNTTYSIIYLDLTAQPGLPPALGRAAALIETPGKKYVNAATGHFTSAGFAATESGPLPLPKAAGYENISLVWETLKTKRPAVPASAAYQYPIAFLGFFFADADLSAAGSKGWLIKEYAGFQLGPRVQNATLLSSIGWRPLPPAFRTAALRAALSLKVAQPVSLSGAYF